MDYRFFEPVDVLYLRGNKLFGGPGDHAEALMPPWPSIAAGSLRTLILSKHGGISFEEYREGKSPQGKSGEVLGTPADPGSFRISFFSLAGRENGKVGPVIPPPADLFISKEEIVYARPVSPNVSTLSSFPLPLVPCIQKERPQKQEARFWLNNEGFSKYLRGKKIKRENLVTINDLWKTETRLGIALSPFTRSAEKGRIYTTETIAINLKSGIGFLVGIQGTKGLLPETGIVRFGGDGRSAIFSACTPSLPDTDWEIIRNSKRFKVLLTTPGFFPAGWLLPGVSRVGENYQWVFGGVKARLVSACIKTHTIVSGWDLVDRRPKPALKAVPAGSVYFFDELDSDISAFRETMEKGLWDNKLTEAYGRRRPEGFNNIAVATWPEF